MSVRTGNRSQGRWLWSYSPSSLRRRFSWLPTMLAMVSIRATMRSMFLSILIARSSALASSSISAARQVARDHAQIVFQRSHIAATVFDVTISRSRRRMILPLRVFGSASVKRICSGLAKLPISCATHWRSSSPEFFVVPIALLQRHETGSHGLAGDLMRLAHHGGFGHRRMMHQRGFDLHGAQAVSADVHHIVHAAQHPVVAVSSRRAASPVI
jgi:hypothetical protein